MLERRRASALQTEVERLKSHLGPDFFQRLYNINPDKSGLPVDPLQSVDKDTRELFQALSLQSAAWSTGLVQYLALDRVRLDVEPTITMRVWWKGELADEDGNHYFVYLADRERNFATPFASAYIVTDLNHQLVSWHGTDIDGPKVLSTELVGQVFPATLKYVEGSRHNGDAGHFSRVLTRTKLTRE